MPKQQPGGLLCYNCSTIAKTIAKLAQSTMNVMMSSTIANTNAKTVQLDP